MFYLCIEFFSCVLNEFILVVFVFNVIIKTCPMLCYLFPL